MSYQFANRFDRLPFNGNSIYSNAQGDFAVSPVAGTKTLSVSGLPFTLESPHVVAGSARSITVSGLVSTLPLSNVSVISGIITLSDVPSNFVGTESILLLIVGPDKATDTALDVLKITEQAPLSNRYTDAEALISSAQALTSGWADLGPEIDCRGYNNIKVWITLDINNAQDARVRVLSKHTYAGSEEYQMPIETPITSGSYTTGYYIAGRYREFVDDTDQLVCFTWDVDNSIPYVQVQVSAGVVGATAGEIDAAYVTKGWK